MQIITIYQGASGSGEELADCVGQALGYAPIDREILVEASHQYGIPETKQIRNIPGVKSVRADLVNLSPALGLDG